MEPYKTFKIQELLENNTYPGRGIVIGMSECGNFAVSAYFIMGRSENSRNRVFTEQGEELMIYPFDSTKVANPELIIYAPVRVYQNHLIVTNGDQTDTIYDYLSRGLRFEDALNTRSFEPDSPNFTPRISGLMKFHVKDFNYKLNILKSTDEAGSECNRYTFSYEPIPGLGHFIHTYNGDGNPIPSFTGEPERVFIPSDIDEFTTAIWNSLNAVNKVALYVRYNNLKDRTHETRIVNKHAK